MQLHQRNVLTSLTFGSDFNTRTVALLFYWIDSVAVLCVTDVGSERCRSYQLVVAWEAWSYSGYVFWKLAATRTFSGT